MLKNIFGIVTLLCFLISCKSNHKAYTEFLNKDSLPSQFIEIDNSRDTSVTTANGAILKIEKGSFSKGNVKLQLKEAYSIEQMVLAGLTTETNGKPLSSGGMIYIASVDKDVAINKPLHVSIPTNFYDNEMQLYKGEEKDGKINWVDPQPLENQDSLPAYLQEGKILFQQNCASCHTYDKDITGPAMKGVELRGPWNERKNLFAFMRNTPAFMAGSPYAQCLKAKYGVVQTSFPQLSDSALNSIFDYIKNEDLKNGIVQSVSDKVCQDSCKIYDSIYRVVNKIVLDRQALVESNGKRINFERSYSDSFLLDSSGSIPDTFPAIDKVEPVNYQAVYYQFDIKTFDWYNVDALVDESGASTELKVETQGSYKDNMSVFLIVPNQRVFAEGGPLTGETNVFGFYTKDGKIALPVGSNIIVFAVGESDGKIYFDYKRIVSNEKQRIILEPKIVSKKEFNRIVKRFRLGDAFIKVKDSKNADAIRKTDNQIKAGWDLLELYRPKNCDCSCGGESYLRPTHTDSTSAK